MNFWTTQSIHLIPKYLLLREMNWGPPSSISRKSNRGFNFSAGPDFSITIQCPLVLTRRPWTWSAWLGIERTILPLVNE